ncbi:hypothetical protein [Acutalibacter muris]|uniref:hypothetical protein n=1 Tax=Acutalibacter muris TaxID=1796620 RepID=UPI001C3EC4EC|nr:hypothetical protein [Acutalibacter muris]
MSKYKIDIMNLVSEAEGLALKLFCRAINSSNADVYIIMAHKAVRLFEVLLEQGYIDPCVGEKLIISHEALDFNCRSLFQKKLVIVDDIMISGTSISSVVNRLVSMGIDQKQIQIITLATDKDYFVMQFDNEAGEDALTCHTEFDDAECIALTATISECFNAYGIPYDVDFPEYAMFEMQDNDLSLFFKEHLWDVKRVDNNPAISTASEGYTFFLRDSFLAELWETLGVDLSKCAALKIRAYIEHLPNNLNRVRCISMCLFRGITTEWLDKLYNLFMPDGHSLSLAPDNEVIAKMRYVQFYVAHRLFEAFLKSISMQNETLIIKGSVHLLFGEQDGETVYDILTHPEPVHREITAIDMTEYDVKCLLKDNDLDSFNNMVKQIQDRGVEITEHDHEINSALTLPFIWWYDQKEIPVRKHIKEIRPHYVRDWEMIRTLLTRLSHGFPMVVLLDIFRDILEDYNVELLLSLFIDRAVDKGIIVPTIYYDRDHKFVSRAYRHGEDLPFALADQCRLVYFIDCLRKAIPAFDGGLEKRGEGIAATSLEKMIVLFYQMGLRKKTVFNRFLGFNNIKLIKPFLSVHGKINAFVDPKDLKKVHIFSEKDENGEEYIVWLTKWLWKKKILISNHEKEEQARVFYVDGRNVHEFLKNNERSCIRDSIKDSIRSIAGMLSTWYDEMATNEGKDAFKEDAIILSSCADPATYASAIATEIHYFSKFWKKQCQETMQAVHSYRRLFDEFAPKSDNYLQSRNTEPLYTVEGIRFGGLMREKQRKSKKESETCFRTKKYLVCRNIWIRLILSSCLPIQNCKTW